MTPRKLSDADKQAILELYRHPGETTSTLGSRYGVSNSTISRILKQGLSEEEYEGLIQQKRGSRSSVDTASDEDPTEAFLSAETSVKPSPPETQLEETQPEQPEQLEMPLPSDSETKGRRSRRRLSAASSESPSEAPIEEPSSEKLNSERLVPQSKKLVSQSKPILVAPVVDSVEEQPVQPSSNKNFATDENEYKEVLDEELLATEELEDLDDDDLDEDFDEDYDGDDDDLDSEIGQGNLLAVSGNGRVLVQVLPLTEAPIPRTCYLVVDRSAELIARPLKDFGDLGQLPETEIQEKTLPIFDNHRVAKRFSNPRTQRVIKLPDGRVLQKTTSHLQAKGITRLLIDGQVYSI